MKIVLISGKQGSGKTTLAHNLRAILRLDPTWRVHVIKFADPIYSMHDAVRHVATEEWGIEMPEKDGRLLQLLGTEWGRKTLGHDIWVKAVQVRVKQLDSPSIKTCVIIDDCRFPNELEAFPDAITVRLDAPERVRKERAEKWREDTEHESETALDYLDPGDYDVFLVTEYTGPLQMAGMIADKVTK